MLVPTPLVFSLLEFFNLNSVVFLITDAEEMDMCLPPLKRQDVYVQCLSVSDLVQDPGIANVMSNTLFVNQDGNYLPEDLSRDFFKTSVYWLVPENEGILEPPTQLRLDSNFFAVSDSLEITEWFRLDGSLLHSDFGSWSEAGGLTVKVPSKKERRSDLNGNTLTIGTLPFPKAVIPRPVGGRMAFTGFVPEIVVALASSMNFTHKWIFPEDKQFGTGLPNGTGTGLIGMLDKGKVHLVGTAMVITPARSLVYYSIWKTL